MGSLRSTEEIEGLVTRFKLEKLLNQGLVDPFASSRTWANNTESRTDQGGRRITLLGSIDTNAALLIAERAAFPSERSLLLAFQESLAGIKNLGANDIYHWYLASSRPSGSAPPDLKLNLIYPCTEQHIKKYSPQGLRMVTETPEVYREHVRPYMQRKREEGRLNWVWNIIEGRTEQEDVILRDHGNGEEGFLMLPDLNWDRKTMSSLHLLALVERRDIWSLRDLKKSHIVWLKHMRAKLLQATVKLYPELEEDMLKLYVHCKSSGLDSDYYGSRITRSTHILPFPCTYCQCHAGVRRHTSDRQSIWPGEPHRTARNSCGRRRKRVG